MENTFQSPAEQFLPTLQALTEQELKAEIGMPDKLRMNTALYGGKKIDIAYAPFDHMNSTARIVIVGITPGRQQMANALLECHRQLQQSAPPEKALGAAKVHASFSGPMRANLVAMLDDIGVARHLGLASTASLWREASDLAHFTSALRYPVFIDGKNYSGAPSMLRVPLLREQVETWLEDEMRRLPEALFVPLGPKVGEALEHVAPRAGIRKDQILTGLPHPSGASAERIAYFLGRKPRDLLSVKTNAARLDQARASLLQKIQKLGA